MSDSDVVHIAREGAIAQIIVDAPPVNAISHAVRVGLLAAIEQLERDDAVQAIILRGAGRVFLAGADVREFDRPLAPPLLIDVVSRLETSRSLLIAAMHGAALGGGAELALACHYRCAAGDLKFGFPEIKLGLLPAAGATVRLPRLVGVPTALDWMLHGESIDVVRAQSLGVIDRVIEGAFAAGALDYARELLGQRAPHRLLREQDVPDASQADTAFFARYRSALPRAVRDVPAAEYIIRSVEATVAHDFEQAFLQARQYFRRCLESRESAALRHLFFAERASPPVAAAPLPVQQIGIVGAGTMGAGIATAFAQAGFPVMLVDAASEALERARGSIASNLQGAVKRGRLTAEAGRSAEQRVLSSTTLGALSEADFIIEAVFEDLSVKRPVFATLGELCGPETILASNTSTLDIDAIAAASGRPERVIGLHFFSPAHIMRLIEVVRSAGSADRAVASGLAIVRKIGKLAVVVGNGFGFVGNRMFYAYGREKELMMLEGASPEQIDGALEEFGMAMGPNAVGDLSGLDVGVSARRQWRDRPDDPRFYRVSELLVEHGCLGRKSGTGFYRYDPQGTRSPDPSAVELIRAEARRLSVSQRALSTQEIQERCLLALINEGALLLEQGIALSAADIDVVWCNGYGFPRLRGGPMFYADTLGLETVVDRMQRLSHVHGSRYWSVAPLLRRLAAEHATLSSWKADAPANS